MWDEKHKEGIDLEASCESQAASCLLRLLLPKPYTQTNLVEYNGNYLATSVLTNSGMWITYKN